MRGLQWARESGQVLAWDSARRVYLLSRRGDLVATWDCPTAIRAAAFSEAEPSAAVLTNNGRLYWLDGKLADPHRTNALKEPLGLCVDTFGQYAIVSSALGETHVLDCYGRRVGQLETSRPLVHLAFLISEPYWVGAAEHGLLGCYNLAGGCVWQEHLLANVGGLAVTDDGQMLLAACFLHGIQRYNWHGANEGTYHLPAPASRVACTQNGELLAAATLERHVVLLNRAGQVLWEHICGEAPLHVALDSIGRCLLVGLPSGEISRWDLAADDEESSGPAASRKADRPQEVGRGPVDASTTEGNGTSPSPRAAALREPDWTIEAASSAERAATAVTAVLERPLRIGLFTAERRLEVFDPQASASGTETSRPPSRSIDASPSDPGRVHRSEPLVGLGRIVAPAPGVMVAATDRKILVYDVRRNESALLPTRFAEITQVIASRVQRDEQNAVRRPRPLKIVLTEEGDRLSLVSPSGQILWTRESKSALVDVVVGPEERIGATTDAGWLLILNEDGEVCARCRPDGNEALQLVGPRTSAGRLPRQFITLSRSAQMIRAFDAEARQLWEVAVPFEPWRLVPAGEDAVAIAANGAAATVDASGRLTKGRSRASPEAHYFALPDGKVACVYAQGHNLICADLTGAILWRHLAVAPPGPIAVSTSGIAVVIGNRLAWFAAQH